MNDFPRSMGVLEALDKTFEKANAEKARIEAARARIAKIADQLLQTGDVQVIDADNLTATAYLSGEHSFDDLASAAGIVANKLAQKVINKERRVGFHHEGHERVAATAYGLKFSFAIRVDDRE